MKSSTENTSLLVRKKDTKITEKSNRIVEIKVEEEDLDRIERARDKRPPTDYIDSFNKRSIGTGTSIRASNLC